ncbi:methyl-accepting chemotaxis protein [Stutzerimonas nitrititolerans]|uniref:methyl-accepting chemotaxis protein n=1 Tax=Stutzerimonas nitrititolerans TaxID=2482751 RepID=UPI002899E462|nr:methyl-accepting chemotaxis protein [Stutzerimonas nitrititolerans]
MWLQTRTIAAKLVAAFGLCACITVAVGGLGKLEVSGTHRALQQVLTDDLLSITRANDVRSNVIAHIRDAYRLIGLVAMQASADERNDTRASMLENQEQVEDLFAEYQATPQSPGEREQATAFEAAWEGYTAAIVRATAELDAGDAAAAKLVLDRDAFPSYRGATNAMKAIINENKERSRIATEAAAAATVRSSWILGAGIAAALLVSMLLGAWITRLITLPVREAMAAAERIAKGDLTQQIIARGQDESAQLLRSLAAMQASLRQTVGQITDASGQLASAATQLHAVARQSSADLQLQNGEIQQAATAVTEMSAAVDEVARNAVSTSEASNQTSDDAEQGREQVRHAIAGISAMAGEITGSTDKVSVLADEISNVGDVLEVIRGIAEQTNLLALNAAIEAARAGEQGRGFAVVADEVRALAHRTQNSTGEIEKLIVAVRGRAAEAVAAMGKTQALAESSQAQALDAGQALERIVAGVSQINERNLVIASASEQQAQVAREVDRNLTAIQTLSSRTSDSALQLTQASESLADLSGRLKGVVGAFRC